MRYELMAYSRLGQGLVITAYPFYWLARLAAWFGRTLGDHGYQSITRGRHDIIWRRV